MGKKRNKVFKIYITMRKKTTTIAIGIPAYNEEGNIENLIRSILSQKEINYQLKEIIVVSDCSHDNTDKIVLGIKDKRIKLIRNSNRIGQALTQNVILENFSSDILALLNADIFVKDKNFLYQFIKPLLDNKKVGIVSPRIVSLQDKNFFSSIIKYSVAFKTFMYEKWEKGNNIYLCHGRARCFSKDFCRVLTWPKVISEDAFSYLLAQKHGFEFVYNKSAVIFYKSPDNFTDHQKQSLRFFNTKHEFKKNFDQKTLTNAYAIPKSIIIQAIFLYLIKSPVLFLSYLTIIVLVRIIPHKTLTVTWDIALSSKNKV